MSQTTAQKIKNYVKKHPVFCNFLLIIVTAVVALWLLDVLFLKPFARHGEEVSVPQVKGLNVYVASDALRRDGFEVQLDSLAGDLGVPGTVINQSPRENSMVKPGRTIYLRYVCFNPRQVRVPAYYGMSRRMALKAFNEAGITNITVKEIPSDTPDLVLSARYNGNFIAPGKDIPVGASVIIEVGKSKDSVVPDSDDSGYYEEIILPEDDDAQFINELLLEGNAD